MLKWYMLLKTTCMKQNNLPFSERKSEECKKQEGRNLQGEAWRGKTKQINSLN